MTRQALNIGTVEGDNTGDRARVGSNKINLNFAELYAFLGGDTLTQTAGSVLLGNGTGALSSFASTAGRLVIGNGASGLTDDANLTWDATNGLRSNKNISAPGSGSSSEAFGSGALARAANDTVLGNGASTPATSSGLNVVVGQGASVTGFGQADTVVGSGATAGGTANVVVGAGNTTSTNSSVVIGVSNTVSGAGGTVGAIGGSVTSSHTGCLTIGSGISSARAYELAFGWANSQTAANPGLRLSGTASVAFAERDVFRIGTTWVDSTDATRKARALLYVSDTAERECIRIEASGSAAMIGFLGATAVVQPATTGTTTGFTAGAGTNVTDQSTFTGNTGASAYTIGDVVLALKQLGLLAA